MGGGNRAVVAPLFPHSAFCEGAGPAVHRPLGWVTVAPQGTVGLCQCP